MAKYFRFRFLLALAAMGVVLAAGAFGGELRLSDDPARWRLALGEEFPGAKGTLDRDDDGALRLSGDFGGGGSYVAAVAEGELPAFSELAFRVKGPVQSLVVRLRDGEGQTHQYDVPLAGDADGWRAAVVRVVDSKAHWGGANDGVFRGTVRSVAVLLHNARFPGERGAILLRDLVLRGATRDGMKFAVRPADLTQSFCAPGGGDPLRLELLFGPIRYVPAPDELDYVYADYAGAPVATGRATFVADGDGALLVPPPAAPGYYDLTVPALGVHTSVVVDRPVADAPADDYFGMDVAFSRGGLGLDAPFYTQLFRVLRKNNIRWIRERMTPGELQPEADRFDFEARRGRYRELRELAAREGLRILDAFHDAPAWNKELRSVKDDYIPGGDTHGAYTQGSNLYPRDLMAAAAGLDAITRRLLPPDAALEVWNEPNIAFGNYFPGEFPVALTKAVSARFLRTGNPVALVGGVFSEAPLGYYGHYVDNGLLDAVDAVSFHAYHAVAPLEGEIARMRAIEREQGSPRAGLPYWVTESGYPWPRGGDRPNDDDARRSAAEIAGKAMELRALGVERHFAFVYRHYNEHQSNHGMLDAHGAPLRSFAAYAHQTRALAHKHYMGDAKIPGAARARVFGDDRGQVACLYAPLRPTPPATLNIPAGLAPRRVEGADGRELVVTDGTIPFTDGLVYVYADAWPEALLDRDTRAAALYKQARDHRPAPRNAAPLVLQPDYDMTAVDYTLTGIDLRPNDVFHARVWVNNFSDATVTAEPALTLAGGLAAEDFPGGAFALAPDGRRLLEFTVRVADERGMLRPLPVRVTDARGGATPLVFNLRQKPDPARFKGRTLALRAMEQPDGWRKNAAGEMTIRRDETENALEFITTFPAKADRWTYPEFVLPEPGMLAGALALGFEAKVEHPEDIRQMLVMTAFSDENEHGAAKRLRLPRPSGAWDYQCVFLPVDVDPKEIRMLRVGVNALARDTNVKIRNVTVFYAQP